MVQLLNVCSDYYPKTFSELRLLQRDLLTLTLSSTGYFCVIFVNAMCIHSNHAPFLFWAIALAFRTDPLLRYKSLLILFHAHNNIILLSQVESYLLKFAVTQRCY